MVPERMIPEGIGFLGITRLDGLPVLLDKRLIVEAEVAGVGLEEASGIRGRRQIVPAVLLHRTQELDADLRDSLDLG